ncbi:MAG: peptidylprolyl isomerase [Flavobacteriales bacterium]|nr:peptidylprolyl isomerase [Flavobacteriales bacterium]
MAVIGKIRNRMGGLLVVLVGGALVLFVVSDFFDNGNRSFGSGDRSVGEIAGEEIDVQFFERRVDEQAEVYRSNGTTVDANLQDQIRNSVWNELLRERTLLAQAQKAGFGDIISREEFDDIRFGNNILPDFKSNPSFQGPDGQPDQSKLRNYFKAIQEQAPMFFEMQKRTFVTERLITKYNTLVKKSCFVNSTQVTDEYTQKNAKASFSFVAKRYDSEPDSLYKPTEEDIRRYYEAHKNEKKWEQRASRSFDYVRFPVVATEADIAAAQQEMADLLPAFRSAKGKEDSTFVMANADTKNAVASAYTEGTADKLNDSLITHADTGAVVGPFRSGDVWKLVKVKELADVEEARVRHILLSTQGKDEATQKAKADSILAAVKRDKGKFEELVKKYSEDPGSVSNGGVYEWFDRTRMVPEFTKASFDEKVGAITICKTSYGFHIVEVLGQRSRKERRVLTVDRRSRPLPATFKEVYKKANELSLNHTDTASFRKAAEEQGLALTPVQDLRADQKYVPGLQDPASVVSWASRAELDGKPSAPIESGEAYVVCMLRSIKQDGVPALEDVRTQFTAEATKEKKAEAFMTLMNGKTDLAALATETKSSVQQASDLPFNSFSIPGGYTEPEVIGHVFGMKPATTSAALKGDQGVYVVNLTSVTPAPAITDAEGERKQLVDRMRQRAENQLFNALRTAAEVKDERSKFY